MIKYIKDIFIFIPNEIFTDLSKLDYSSNSHFAFAVSYYYLVTYLYYTTYYGCHKLKPADLKQELGYNPTEQRIDYIIKKNGLLDESKYTYNTSDYPICITKDQLNDEYNPLEFETIDDYRDDYWLRHIKYESVSKRYSIKYPIKAFARTAEDYEDGITDSGTFFSFENTIKVYASTFSEIIKNRELGCVGFLIYLYIKSNRQLIMGYDQMSIELKVSRSDLIRKIKVLKDNGFIHVEVSKSYPVCNLSNVYRALK